MEGRDFYRNAHLVVSAIRILEHQKGLPPSIESVCRCLALSLEQGHLICRKLSQLEIIKIVEGGFGTKLFIQDHLKVEEIPTDATADGLEQALRKFQNEKRDYSKKIESIQAQHSQKQKSLFAELEKKLKQDLEKK